MNHHYAMEVLTKQEFETEEIGPAWLGIPKELWPWGADRSVLVLVYLRLTMRPDASRGWIEGNGAKLLPYGRVAVRASRGRLASRLARIDPP
ncbi:MAG: hypothetical protein ACOYKN_20265 [Pirellula sp.]